MSGKITRAFSSPTSTAALEILIATRGAHTATVNAHLIWSTIRGLVAVQLTWPEPLDSTRDRQMLVDVVTAYLAEQTGDTKKRR